MLSAIDKAVVGRLRELAAGASPRVALCGICKDVSYVYMSHDLPPHDGYLYCEEVFAAMGLDRHYPLGDAYGPMWRGEAGERRRALCTRMADHIEGVWP